MTRPPYNHTRDDGPFAPCPVCLQLMSREELIEYASDLDMQVRDLVEEREDCTVRFCDCSCHTVPNESEER